MATSTFDKRIIIDDKAADVLIALLKKPAPPRPDISGKFREITEEDWKCFLQKHSVKQSEQKQN
ncbi:MAG: hypothetical protein LBC28_05225 [Oscillospiraceae bacterium]|jgi:hypothetical protein|nr:hypothetical protein [Oscillospiraceae bacterium]